MKQLIGEDLCVLGDSFLVTRWKGEKLNKGWAGHVIERYLGLPLSSSRAPNFGSWELKLVSLKKRGDGLKETMQLTMLDPVEVLAKEFHESHLYTKMRKALVVARVFESKQERCSRVHSVSAFDLDDTRVYELVKADYDLVRIALKENGFSALSGKMGLLVQPRTKGPGHGSTSRAFYARAQFVSHIIGLTRHPLLSPPDASD